MKKEKIKAWFKDKYNLAFVAILIFAFAIRLYYFFLTKNQPLWWDEAEYMLKAKNIAFHTPDTGWFSLRPIMFSLIAVLFLKIGFGEIGLRFLFMLLSLSSLILLFYIGKELANKKIALIAVFLMSVFYLDLFYTNRLLVDMPQVFFVLLGTLFFIRYFFKNDKKAAYFILPILFFGSLIRFTVGLMIIVLLFYLFLIEKFSLFKKKELYVSLIIGILVFSPYLIYAKVNYGNPFHAFIGVATSERAPQDTPLNVFLQYVKYFPSYLGGIKSLIFFFFVFGILFIFFNLFISYGLISKKENLKKFLFLILWLIIPLIYFGFFVNHFEDRYIFIIFPAVFILIGESLEIFYEYIKKYNKILGIFLVLGILIFSSYNMLSYSNFIIKAKLTSYDSLKEAGLWIKENTNKSDIIFSSGVPQNTYYSERATYSYPETEKEFEEKINELKPRYMVLSIWEKSPEWAYDWPSKHNETVKLIRAYFLNNEKTKPDTLIYDFIK